jgi:hypothetical protein
MPAERFALLAHCLQIRRQHHAHFRAFVLAANCHELAQGLERIATGNGDEIKHLNEKKPTKLGIFFGPQGGEGFGGIKCHQNKCRLFVKFQFVKTIKFFILFNFILSKTAKKGKKDLKPNLKSKFELKIGHRSLDPE